MKGQVIDSVTKVLYPKITRKKVIVAINCFCVRFNYFHVRVSLVNGVISFFNFCRTVNHAVNITFITTPRRNMTRT